MAAYQHKHGRKMGQQRRANGQFENGHQLSKGNKGGGRPRRTTEEKYLRAFRAELTEKDIRDIVNSGLSFAKAGDVRWARLLFEYGMGKPTQYVDAQISQDVTIEVVCDDSV